MNPWMTAGVLLEPLLSLVFPARCVCCSSVGLGWLCPGCCSGIVRSPGPRCGRCDLPLRDEGDCPDCRSLSSSLVRTVAVGAYAGPLKRALQALKFERRWELCEPLARLLACRVQEGLGEVGFDLIGAIPIDAAREALRGYNQAGLLAWRTAVRLGIPYRPGLLVRTRGGTAQSRSSRARRRPNVEGAFVVPAPQAVRGRRVLLLDDVMTTGATLDAAASVLAEAGAQVWGLVVARGELRRLKGRKAA